MSVNQRLEKKGFQFETAVSLGNCALGNWVSEWVMLSFPCTNNWGALEQVIYPTIAPVEMFSVEEECGFAGKIRGMCVGMNVSQEKTNWVIVTKNY